MRIPMSNHGYTVKGQRNPTYCAWDSMVQRCFNPKNPQYKDYGGRGITVHPELRTFVGFLAHMGNRPEGGYSLERIDNNKGYEPNNLKWATRKEQQRNRRCCKRITFNGVTKTAVEWCEHSGIELGTLLTRLRVGWSVEKALTAPLQKLGRPRTRPRTV